MTDGGEAPSAPYSQCGTVAEMAFPKRRPPEPEARKVGGQQLRREDSTPRLDEPAEPVIGGPFHGR